MLMGNPFIEKNKNANGKSLKELRRERRLPLFKILKTLKAASNGDRLCSLKEQTENLKNPQQAGAESLSLEIPLSLSKK